MTLTVIAGETPGGPFIVETLDASQDDPKERLDYWQSQADHGEWELYLAKYNPESGDVSRIEESLP